MHFDDLFSENSLSVHAGSRPTVQYVTSLSELPQALLPYYTQGYVLTALHPIILSVGRTRSLPFSLLYRAILARPRPRYTKRLLNFKLDIVKFYKPKKCRQTKMFKTKDALLLRYGTGNQKCLEIPGNRIQWKSCWTLTQQTQGKHTIDPRKLDKIWNKKHPDKHETTHIKHEIYRKEHKEHETSNTQLNIKEDKSIQDTFTWHQNNLMREKTWP